MKIIPKSLIDIPVRETDNYFNKAYDLFNKRLHNGALPGGKFDFRPLSKSLSQFKAAKVHDIQDGYHDHIIINSTMLLKADEIKILAALDDAMISQEQFYFGEPGRNAYRNKERASMSKEVGLFPSNTGQEGGKETGDYLSFYIIEDSPFYEAAKEFLSYGYKIQWEEIKQPPAASNENKNIKYVCPDPDCKQSFRSKMNAQLNCAFHNLLCVIEVK